MSLSRKGVTQSKRAGVPRTTGAHDPWGGEGL